MKETDATGWFTRREMDNLTLHPQFSKRVNTGWHTPLVRGCELSCVGILYGREILLPVNPVRNS